MAMMMHLHTKFGANKFMKLEIWAVSKIQNGGRCHRRFSGSDMYIF